MFISSQNSRFEVRSPLYHPAEAGVVEMAMNIPFEWTRTPLLVLPAVLGDVLMSCARGWRPLRLRHQSFKCCFELYKIQREMLLGSNEEAVNNLREPQLELLPFSPS